MPSPAAARPPKRPGDGDDSTSPPGGGLAQSSKVKLPRIERYQEDFSTVVKSKLQSFSRTGQACDRCKVSSPRRSSHLSLCVVPCFALCPGSCAPVLVVVVASSRVAMSLSVHPQTHTRVRPC